MPLWLDLLRTPMAAPETRFLKIMRRAWMALCLVLAATIALFGPIRSLIGPSAPRLVAGLLLLTAVQTLVYFRVKGRADNAYLMTAGERE
ncbi:hypothetical protein [Sphingobium estronivorans]|uniref:hypothetical protein n=1 Tax=Sphingobium estronivorans TaxID=1577690 RepID=UPI00123B481F|nr:hypothetical protein [Sphingobium estronivorans]